MTKNHHNNEPPPLKEGLDVIADLGKEMGWVLQLPNSVPGRFSSRLILRTFFSLIEAFAFFLESRCIEAHRYGYADYSGDELAFLREGEEKMGYSLPSRQRRHVTIHQHQLAGLGFLHHLQQVYDDPPLLTHGIG